MDRREFIDELRKKIPLFTRDRITGWRKKYAEKEALFNERLESYIKRLDEIQVRYNIYIIEGLPRDVKREKQRAILLLLLETIGVLLAILIVFMNWVFIRGLFKILIMGFFGFFAGFFSGLAEIFNFPKWISPKGILNTTPWIIIAVVGFFYIIFLVKFFRIKRSIKTQEFAGELAGKWLDNNGFTEVESNIKAVKDE